MPVLVLGSASWEWGRLVKDNIQLLVKRSFKQPQNCHGQLDLTLSRVAWNLQYNGTSPAATDSFVRMTQANSEKRKSEGSYQESNLRPSD